jgi:hypothetical protein
VEYGEAPSRWAAGAIQLCGVEARRSWLMILSILSTYFFLPFLLTFVIYFVERSHFIIAAIELVILGSLFIIAPLFRYYFYDFIHCLYILTPKFAKTGCPLFNSYGECLLLVSRYFRFKDHVS